MTKIELDCLAALGRERDIDRAAAVCGMSAPDFSRALLVIEKQFATTLLKAGDGFGGFTRDGERILDWAQRSLAECDRLREEVRASHADRVIAPLLQRRSVSPKRLVGPGPDQADIDRMLKGALRAPDHGGLHPWRVMEFKAAHRGALASLFEKEKLRRDPLASDDDLRRAREHATRAPVLLAFVISPHVRSRVPVREQWLSAGAALGNLLNAAHRLGYGAIMLSGERCFDADLALQLGLAFDEFLAGFISIGHVTQEVPDARVIPTENVWSSWEPGNGLPASQAVCGAMESPNSPDA